MKKIIDIVVGLPTSCETSKFPASFASAWMRIEGLTTEEQAGRFHCDRQLPNGDCCGRCGHVTKLGKRQESAHNLYAVVSGISLMQLDLSREEHLTPWWGPNTTRLLDEYDDYVKFTMGFAGYSYERLSKQSGEAVVFEAVKRSIDADRPALMNFGPFYDWFVITGYDDETGRLYGYDGPGHSWGRTPSGLEYEDGMFSLGGWYEEMSEAVVVTGRAAPSLTYDDMFRRMVRILEAMQEKGYFRQSAEYLRDSANFESYGDGEYAQLAERIEGFIGLPIDQRNVISCCFHDLARVEALEDRWQYFKRISAVYDNTLSVCWIAWRMVGAFSSAPREECVRALASPIVRRAIADIVDVVRDNDDLVLNCLQEMMA